MEKYSLPPFLAKKITKEVYKKWLQRKAAAHFRKDTRRGFKNISVTKYKELIHQAILESKGKDAYTGEDLNWKLISKYDNKKAKNLGGKYKKKFYYLPTVDHETPNKKNPSFKICSWKINDIKNDLTLEELLIECKKLIKYNKS